MKFIFKNPLWLKNVLLAWSVQNYIKFRYKITFERKKSKYIFLKHNPTWNQVHKIKVHYKPYDLSKGIGLKAWFTRRRNGIKLNQNIDKIHMRELIKVVPFLLL